MTPKFISTIFAFTAATALVPCVAFSDTFEARSSVSKATIYVEGASITRDATLTLPAGQHQITFVDIPVRYGSLEADSLQTQVSNGKLGPVSVSPEALTERDIREAARDLPEYATYIEIEDKLKKAKRDVEAIDLEVTAADDALRFISALSAPENATATDLADFSKMVRVQSLEARMAAQDAKIRSRAASDIMDDLTLDLQAAEAELAKVAPVSEERLRVTFDLTLEAPGDVDVSFTYLTEEAYWAPAYEVDLDTVENTLTLDRSLVVLQNTDEPWIDVGLTVSTDVPFQNVAPTKLREYTRRITDPVQPRVSVKMEMQSDIAMAMSAPVIEVAPVVLSDTASVGNYGLSQSYDYPRPVTLLSSDKAQTELAMDAISFTPDLKVRAVPLYDDAGYLIVDMTNDSGEALLQGAATLFRDGAYIGTHQLSTIVDSADFTLPFGRMEGVKVSRVVLDRNEGDRGFISKSNETTSSVRLDVENLTARSWPIEVMDRVSVSEQEDLTVEWTATPMPTEQNVDDRRGVLSWRFDLPAGETQSVQLEENLGWPEGKILR